MLTPKKETLAQKNARMRKEIAAREKRIADKAKEDEKNSSSNQRANRVIGNYKTGGTTQCVKCGGQKMAKGGTKLAAAGIPYATGAGQTDGKNGMMKKGGKVKKGSSNCPPGYHVSQGSGPCIKDTNVLSGTGLGLGILGALGAGIGGTLIGTGEKAIARSKARDAKKAENKKLDDAAKKLSSTKVMKKGGALKPVSTNQKGLAKLPTAVRNKMGYQKKGGVVKKK